MNGPNHERSTAVAKNNVTILTLFGNLGGTPDVRVIPAQEVTRPVYDPVTDQVVEKTFAQDEREFRTFSIAVSTREMEEPRWIRCVDWNNLSRLFQKGDRVRLTGFFQVRTYEKNGETRRVRQFVVKTATLERAKIPQDMAA
jgi:single-stranded DNA-binding protein